MVIKMMRSESAAMNFPRSLVMSTGLARTDCAAVAPRQTTIFGFTTSSSASSQGLHAITCLIDGC